MAKKVLSFNFQVLINNYFMGPSLQPLHHPVQNCQVIVAQKRIKNQLSQIKKKSSLYWTVVVKDWNRWIVTVITQIDTPFHTIPFNLIVEFPNTYPQKNPTIKFQNPSKIFHPNICWKNNYICEASLNNIDPAISTRKRIENVIQLLKTPNIFSPCNVEAVQEINKNSIRGYFRRAFFIYRGEEINPPCCRKTI